MNLILTAMYNTPGPSTPFAPGVNAFYIFGSLCGFSSVLWGGAGWRGKTRLSLTMRNYVICHALGSCNSYYNNYYKY